MMSAQDSAVLMGFKASWRLAKSSRNAQRMVGNALCVQMARSIMQAAISIETATPMPAAEPARTVANVTPTRVGKQKRGDYRRLKKRIRTIETLVRKLHSSTTQH